VERTSTVNSRRQTPVSVQGRPPVQRIRVERVPVEWVSKDSATVERIIQQGRAAVEGIFKSSAAVEGIFKSSAAVEGIIESSAAVEGIIKSSTTVEGIVKSSTTVEGIIQWIIQRCAGETQTAPVKRVVQRIRQRTATVEWIIEVSTPQAARGLRPNSRCVGSARNWIHDGSLPQVIAESVCHNAIHG
jgi:hypothetical protein